MQSTQKSQNQEKDIDNILLAYLVLWKNYLENENTWNLSLAI